MIPSVPLTWSWCRLPRQGSRVCCPFSESHPCLSWSTRASFLASDSTHSPFFPRLAWCSLHSETWNVNISQALVVLCQNCKVTIAALHTLFYSSFSFRAPLSYWFSEKELVMSVETLYRCMASLALGFKTWQCIWDHYCCLIKLFLWMDRIDFLMILKESVSSPHSLAEMCRSRKQAHLFFKFVTSGRRMVCWRTSCSAPVTWCLGTFQHRAYIMLRS